MRKKIYQAIANKIILFAESSPTEDIFLFWVGYGYLFNEIAIGKNIFLN